MKSRMKAGRPLASIARVLAGAGILGLTVLLSSCGGGGSDSTASANNPPAGSPGTNPGTEPGTGSGTGTGSGVQGGLAANGDIQDGYDYSALKSVPLQNVTVTILPPDGSGACYSADGAGYGVPAGGTGGNSNYGGCTLAMVNSGVKENQCQAIADEPLPLITDPTFKPYVRVLFSADGYPTDPAAFAVTGNGQMKLNGHSTRCAEQKGYEIQLGKFDKVTDPTGALSKLVQPYNGLMNVLLKKHPYDLTRIRNALSFYLFRSVTDMVSRPTWFLHATFIDQSGDPNTQKYLSSDGQSTYGCSRLSTSGQTVTSDCGLFEDIEEDDNWMLTHKQDPNGQFWEAQNFWFAPATISGEAGNVDLTKLSPDSSSFGTVIEPQDKGYDPTDLINMLNAVNGGLNYYSVTDYPNSFETAFNQYFHPDNFRAWLAMNILVGNEDTNTQNFFLYKPSTSTKFYFAPWDYDGAWGFNNQTDSTPQPQSRATQGVSNWWDMLLVRRYLMASGEPAQLTDKVNQLRSTVFSDANIQNVVNTALSLASINGVENQPPDNAFPDAGQATTAQRQAEIARLYTSVVAQNLADYEVSLKRPMPVTGQDVTNVGQAVTFSSEPSFSIAGNQLVYDLVLAKAAAPNLFNSNQNDPNCTTADTPVPLMPTSEVMWTGYDNSAAQLAQGIPLPALATPALGTQDQYYLQVIARDATTNYCQIADGSTTDSNGSDAFGVFGFKWDGTNVILPQ